MPGLVEFLFCVFCFVFILVEGDSHAAGGTLQETGSFIPQPPGGSTRGSGKGEVKSCNAEAPADGERPGGQAARGAGQRQMLQMAREELGLDPGLWTAEQHAEHSGSGRKELKEGGRGVCMWEGGAERVETEDAGHGE